ncbi:MAG TPA: restriction endonuclease subunit S, partial [Steroidobacteraceae bacterium]
QLGGGRVALAQRLICLRGDPQLLDNDFLKYLMQSEGVQEQLRSRASGTTVLGIKQSELRKIVLTLPPLGVQSVIAHVLGALDEKIELNRRMSETLDALAQSIFESWFVRFDPVRAKESGESSGSICGRLGLTPEMLAVFPDRCSDSAVGEIPAGWDVVPLEELVTYLNRGLSPRYLAKGGVLVLNQKCVRDGRVDVSKGRRHDPARRKVDSRLLQAGDILINSTGTGTLGRIGQMLTVGEPTVTDSHVTTVRADPVKVSWNYLGVDLQAREAEIEAFGAGSTGQTELSRARLAALPVLLPPKPLRDYFDEIVLGLRLRARQNDEQNRTLAAIRDSLLPNLLSGDARI